LKRLLIRLGLREAFRSVLSEARGTRSPCIAWIWTASSRSTTGMDTRLGTNFLQAIADRLRAVVPGRAAVARVGGDEFVIVQGPILQPDEAEHLAERIDHAIAGPCLIDGRDVRVGISIGFVTAQPGSLELDPRIIAADAALYRAKASKRDARIRRAAKPVDSVLPDLHSNTAP